jgi:flagellar biosynthetic protein FliO
VKPIAVYSNDPADRVQGSGDKIVTRPRVPYAGLAVLLSVVQPAWCAEQSASLEPLSLGSLLEVTLGLSLVLGLFVAIAFMLRRLSGVRNGSSGEGMRMVAGMSLGTRDRIVLLEVRQHHVLLGLSPGRIQPLHVFAPSDTKKEFNGELLGQLEKQADVSS